MQASQPLRQPRSVSTRATSMPVSAKQHAKVTITETCQIAATCRSKLGKEAERSDLKLRRLVGHANLLDEIAEKLEHAEREFEALLDVKACVASTHTKQPPKLQWMNTIPEEFEEEDDGRPANDSVHKNSTRGRSACRAVRQTAKSPPPKPWSEHFIDEIDNCSDDDSEGAEDDEDSRRNELSLRRLPYSQRVPELTYDGDSGSDEEEAPHASTTICIPSYAKRQNLTTGVVSRNDSKCGRARTPVHVLVVVES